MARGADGSLLTAKQLKELNRQRFLDGVDAGNLYSTGPITEEGGTEFGTDRWASYFKKNPDEAPSDWTGDSKSYLEAAPEIQEFVADADEMKVFEDGELVYADGKDVGDEETSIQERGMLGSRGEDGSLTVESAKRDTEKAARAERIAAKKAQITQNTADIAAIDVEAEKILDDLAKIKEEKAGYDAEMAESDKVMAELEKEQAILDAEDERIRQEEIAASEDLQMEEDLSDAELEQMMMEATADQGTMEEDDYKRKHPYQFMSEEEKGMFTYKDTEDTANKKTASGVNIIMNATGMNEQQAQQLLNQILGSM